MSAKKKTSKTVRDLSQPEKIKIMKRVASGQSIAEIAKDNGIRYASIQHVVLRGWAEYFPLHYAAFATPRTVSQFKKTPPPFRR